MTDLHWLYLRRNSSLVGVFFPAPVENSVCWACAMNLSEQNLCLICWHYWSCEMDFFFPTANWFRICHFPVSIHQSASLCDFTINMKCDVTYMWGGRGDRQDDLRSNHILQYMLSKTIFHLVMVKVFDLNGNCGKGLCLGLRANIVSYT